MRGLDELEGLCRERDLPLRPVLVMVGWAGNDVWGNGGYKGVPWIHQAKFNKTQADREVSATWCERQRKEVDRQVTLLGGLKGSDSRIADILMLSNADADDYDLPSAYNASAQRAVGLSSGKLRHPCHRPNDDDNEDNEV